MTNGEALYQLKHGLDLLDTELNELRAQLCAHMAKIEAKRRVQLSRDRARRLCRESTLTNGGQHASVDQPAALRGGGSNCGGACCPGPIVKVTVE